MTTRFQPGHVSWSKGKVLSKRGNRIDILGGVGLIIMKRGIALIDIEDIERVKGYTWYFDGKQVRTHLPGLPRRTLKLSRLVLYKEKHTTIKEDADHVFHNQLDNRKQSLRPATSQQNNCNKLSKKHTSNYRGVYRVRQGKKWRSAISLNYKIIHLGYFINELDAAIAYNEAAKKLHGEFATLNIFPKEA